MLDATEKAIADRQFDWDLVLRRASIRFKPTDGPSVGSILFRNGGGIAFQIVLPQSPEEHALVNPYSDLPAKWKAPYNEWAWDISSVGETPDPGPAVDIVRRFL